MLLKKYLANDLILAVDWDWALKYQLDQSIPVVAGLVTKLTHHGT